MDREWLIGEVAKRHGVVLQKADPVFVTVTLNELVLGEYIRQANAALAEVHEESVRTGAHEMERARTAGAESIRRAGTYAAGQVRSAGMAVREELTRSLKTEVEAMAVEVASARRHRAAARWYAVAAVGAAVVVVGTALARVAGR